MSDFFEKEYGKQYHTYPVGAMEFTHEGSFKRFSEFPTPKEVFDYALLGLSKVLPLTQEQITPEFATTYLESAITEIEMELNCNLSEIDHFHSEDYVDGMFQSNFLGIKLRKWPATEIKEVLFKFPHTNTTTLYQTYSIPPSWVYLHKNKVNVIASMGGVSVARESPSIASVGGIFSYAAGFARGAYQPGAIEITYTAGFKHDKLPNSVADLVKTWAAHRMLTDLIPVLFPSSSVDVAIDGVRQGVSFSMQQMLSQKIDHLEKKKNELKSNFRKGFGRTIKTSFIGA